MGSPTHPVRTVTGPNLRVRLARRTRVGSGAVLVAAALVLSVVTWVVMSGPIAWATGLTALVLGLVGIIRLVFGNDDEDDLRAFEQ